MDQATVHNENGRHAEAPRATQSRRPSLWRMVAWVALGHAVLIVALSPSLFGGRGETLDELYARGEQLVREEKYAEAMGVFKRILDRQPKPAPVFDKAADQHRLADRLQRQKSSTRPAPPAAVDAPRPSSPAPDQSEPTFRPTSAPATHAKPAAEDVNPFIPPELRPLK
jgi:hypothetical protein